MVVTTENTEEEDDKSNLLEEDHVHDEMPSEKSFRIIEGTNIKKNRKVFSTNKITHIIEK